MRAAAIFLLCACVLPVDLGGDGAGDGGVAEPVSLPGGDFIMGCTLAADPQCMSEEQPAHVVRLSAFKIDRSEVTQGQYASCVDAGVCSAPSCDWDPAARGNYPVVCVRWSQAVAYCGYRGAHLPTEAQWEFAAHPDGGRYPWGDAPPSCSRALYSACDGGATEPVGQRDLGASALGVLGLADNVSEWIGDYYDTGYYAVSPTNDPPGPATGSPRGIRGGAFDLTATTLRATYRTGDAPELNANPDIGFRCAQ
jgi:formylglycine-generating enzyme required for sulfatase activity